MVLILLFSFLQIYSVVHRDTKVDNFASSLFLLIIIRSDLLARIRWSICMLKSHRSLCVSFSRTGAELCIYHLLVWSNFNFLHISQWITLSTQSCLALYSFCANLLHSLIVWLIVSFLFSCVLLFSLWYDWSLWRCPVLLLGEIPFLYYHYHYYYSFYYCYYCCYYYYYWWVGVFVIQFLKPALICGLSLKFKWD